MTLNPFSEYDKYIINARKLRDAQRRKRHFLLQKEMSYQSCQKGNQLPIHMLHKVMFHDIHPDSDTFQPNYSNTVLLAHPSGPVLPVAARKQDSNMSQLQRLLNIKRTFSAGIFTLLELNTTHIAIISGAAWL